MKLHRRVSAFLCSECGPVAVEYAVLLALLAGAIAAAASTFGDVVFALYVTIRTALGG
ncbi:MAG: Flp family type IVb pilin [Planctomycetota bacterium]